MPLWIYEVGIQLNLWLGKNKDSKTGGADSRVVKSLDCV